MSIFAGIVGRFRSFLVAPGESGRRWGRALLTCTLLLGAAIQVQAAETSPLLKLPARLRETLADPATQTTGIGRTLRSQVKATGHDDTIFLQLDVIVNDANLAAISATGASVTSTSVRWNAVSVEATADQIVALANLPAVAAVKVPRSPFHRAQPGTVVNQAGAVIHADDLTTTSNITGIGQTVGIISDSINFTTAVGTGTTTGSIAPFTLTGTLPQSRGDLPASIQIVEFGTNSVRDPATDEGEAMMEECFKLAPGATYAFGSCNKAGHDPSQQNMADTIADLASKSHCTIMADDIGFFDEPMFQDGPIAQAANTFVQNGGIYLSAYGNDGVQGIQTGYLDVSTTVDPHTGYPLSTGFFPTGNDFHDWGIGGATPGFLPLDITGPFTITLEWNQPFHSFGLGAGSQSNYDMYLFTNPVASKDNLVDAITPGLNASQSFTVSMENQGTIGSPAGDPLEIIQFQIAGGGPHHVFLAIDKVGGASGDLLRVVIHCNTLAFPSGGAGVQAMTGFGHPTAAGVLGIAAARFSTPNVPESLTSKGGIGGAGVPFFFNTTGGALAGAPQLRDKPELTAPDGVATSNSGFNPFFGTSAAVPNATAAAALTWSANPTLTNAQVTARMIATAKDIDGGAASTGNDAISGHGMVEAQRSAGVPVTNITATPSTGLVEAGNIDISVTFAFPVTATGTPRLALNTTPARFATFLSGSGTTALVFRYTITTGDASTHLDLANANALTFNGGTMTATSTGVTFTAGDPIMLLLPTPGATNSLGANTTIDVDTTGPVATIVGNPATKQTSDLTFDVTFAQAVTGLGTGSFTVTNGTVTSVTGSGASYVAHVTATAPGTVTLSIAANTVFDAGSLGNHAASGTATFDIVAPTLVITPTLNSVVTTTSVSVTFTFSEAVTGFAVGDITITNGTAGALTGSGAVYHMPVTAGSPGPLTITVLGGTVTDLANNASTTDATATVTVTEVPASSVHGCGLGSMFASVFGLGLLALMAWARGRDGVTKR